MPGVALVFARTVAVGLAALLGACAAPEAPRAVASKELIFPQPPDEARFVYERSIYSSGDVQNTSVGGMKELLTGASSEGVEPLSKPYAIAVHQGRIFVSDSAERFVKVFDVPQGLYFRIGDEDPGALRKPLGLDVDRAGNLYVADATAKAIMVYTRDGTFLRKIGEKKDFDRLSSVTVNPEGTRLYVTDIGGVSSENHRVRVFDAVAGKHLMDIGKRGRENGEFNLPRDVAIGKDGRLYVVDGGNFRIQVFDKDGQFLKTFGKIGKQLGDFARPKEIAADREGNVYVVDTAFGNFQIFTAEGELLMYIGERSEGDGPAKYQLPSGIFVDEDGRVYMVDQWYRKVEVFRPYNLKAGQGYLTLRKDAGKR